MSEPRKPAKQAVIVVHGMGEQRPMETVRSLIVSLLGKNEQSLKQEKEPFHVIPDNATGMNELSRIRVSSPPRGEKGMRTDFYELYYADLFTGNTLDQLSGWARGLLFRWPHQIPRGMLSLWVFLWIAGLSLTAWIGSEFADDPLGRIKAFFLSGLSQSPQLTALQSAMLSMFGLFFIWKLVSDVRRHSDADATRPDVTRTYGRGLSYLTAFAAPLLVCYFLWRFLPWKQLVWPFDSWCGNSALWCPLAISTTIFGLVWFKLLAAGVLYTIIRKFGTPVFGDVARYLRMSPDAISNRTIIRDRAVRLLEELHDKRAQPDLGEESPPEYRRIVVVAHSLGSLVAFDALRIYWAKHGPRRGKPLPKEASPLIDEIINSIHSKRHEPRKGWASESFDHKLFAVDQKKLVALVASDPLGYRVSDFITLGSPLAHADFLLARDWPRFFQSVRERSIPICPPLLEIDTDSFMYEDPRTGTVKMHHAAHFALTRWTAIFDPKSLLFLGDFIGGPLRPLFGFGIADVPVKIVRPQSVFSRLFTHTSYWDECVKAHILNPGSLADDLSGAQSSRQGVLEILRRLVWPEADASNQPVMSAGKPSRSRSSPAQDRPARAGKPRPKPSRAGRTSPPS